MNYFKLKLHEPHLLRSGTTGTTIIPPPPPRLQQQLLYCDSFATFFYLILISMKYVGLMTMKAFKCKY